LYVVTSARTFSAAEAAAYHLKYLVHATIVGGVTGGGAHRIRSVDLGSGFVLRLPFTRSMNVVTNTDWEGIGLTPDVPTTPERALNVAHLAALQRLPSSAARRVEIRRLGKLLQDGTDDIGPTSPAASQNHHQ
jgi:C-terminal processing protease CtpA/Prc